MSKKYKYTDEDIHRLIVLTAALQYELEKVEEIRKEISKLRLKKLTNKNNE